METTNGSDLYSSSENSPESQRLVGMTNHHQQQNLHNAVVGHHQPAMLSSRLSPVSPATSVEDVHHQHHLVQHHQHLQQQQHLGHVPVGISVISSSSQQQQHLHGVQHNGPDEDPTHQQT